MKSHLCIVYQDLLYIAIVNHKRRRKTKANIMMLQAASLLSYPCVSKVKSESMCIVHWAFQNCVWNKSRIIPSLFPSAISSCWLLRDDHIVELSLRQTEFWPFFTRGVFLSWRVAQGLFERIFPCWRTFTSGKRPSLKPFYLQDSQALIQPSPQLSLFVSALWRVHSCKTACFPSCCVSKEHFIVASWQNIKKTFIMKFYSSAWAESQVHSSSYASCDWLSVCSPFVRQLVIGLRLRDLCHRENV